MKVAIDTSPLKSGHSTRGIGYYTRYLLDSLTKYCPEVTIVKDTIAGADIVHYPFFDLYFLTLPLRKPKPTVVTIHDVIPLVFADKFPAGHKGRLKLQLQKFSLSSAKAIITDSYHSKVDITKYLGIHENKVHVAYLAVDEKFCKLDEQTKQKMKDKYSLPDIFFLYIGDVNYNKNIPNLIRAFTKLPHDQAHLVLVGKAFENKNIPEVQEINHLIEHSEKLHQIHVLGFVPDEDIVALYNLATAYVQPSLYEGFGLPVLEAMQCGTPVISSDRSSLKEIIGDTALVIDPEDKGSIRHAFQKVLDDEPLRQDLSQRGLIQAQKFTQKNFATQTVNVYQEVYENHYNQKS